MLITEPPFNPKKNKEMMAKILFEKFDVPAVCFHGPVRRHPAGVGSVASGELDSANNHTSQLNSNFASCSTN